MKSQSVFLLCYGETQLDLQFHRNKTKNSMIFHEKGLIFQRKAKLVNFKQNLAICYNNSLLFAKLSLSCRNHNKVQNQVKVLCKEPFLSNHCQTTIFHSKFCHLIYQCSKEPVIYAKSGVLLAKKQRF